MKKVSQKYLIKKWIETFLVSDAIFVTLWTIGFLTFNLKNWFIGASLISIVTLIIIVVWAVNYAFTIPGYLEGVVEYTGKKCRPLKPGLYFFYPLFGLLKLVSYVDLREQTICILLGEEKGLEKSLIEQYPYGSRSNVEPAEGSDLRLLIKLIVKPFDSSLAYYSSPKVFSQIALLAENFIRKSMNNIDNTSQNIIRKNIEDVDRKLTNYLSTAVNNYGYSLIEGQIVDIIYSAKTIEAKEKFEVVEIEGEILEKEMVNEKKRSAISIEKARGETASLEELAKSSSMSEAMKYRLQLATLETVALASKSGSITYIEPGNFKGGQSIGNAAMLGTGIAFGISNNKKIN